MDSRETAPIQQTHKRNASTTLPLLNRKTSLTFAHANAHDHGEHSSERHRVNLKKQESVSIGVEEVRKHRRFDPRFQLSTTQADIIEEQAEETAEGEGEYRAGQILLEKARSRSLRMNSSRSNYSPRGLTTCTPKNLALELMHDSQGPDSLPPLLPSGARPQPRTHEQMMSKYMETMDIMQKKRQRESDNSKMNVPSELTTGEVHMFLKTLVISSPAHPS